LSRIVPEGADDLDDVLVSHDRLRGQPGGEIFPNITAALAPLSAMKRPDTVCVGIRVSAALADAADHALRLVSFAAERTVEVVILAETDATGLERFGFRIERVVGSDAKARSQCEAQICRFWNIDLVL
jgi:hypothetical protein